VSKMRTRSSSFLGAVVFGAVLAAALAGLVLPLFITRSLSLAPVPVPHAVSGIFWALCCGSLGFGGGDPLSAQAQRPSRPSGGNKAQEPADNQGSAGAGFSLAVDRAKIAADRHRHCPCRAHKSRAFTCIPRTYASNLADRDEFRVKPCGTASFSGTHRRGASLARGT